MPLDEFKTQVLLLHSDQRTLDNLGSQFSDRYTVHCATSGAEALNALAEAPINVFISAHDLPGMSGLEALREAKKRSPETLGILLAGDEGEEVEALVGDEEVFQVVHGNVDQESLLELVESAAREVRLATLSESANDTTAKAGDTGQHIVMETADNGASIISQSSARLRALSPKAAAAAAPVDVMVLTTDDEFLKTIESSTGSRHKVRAARTLAEASEVIRSHQVGVAVVDAAIVRDKIEQLTQYLRRESSRLVPIVAGRRDDGEMLMDLINRGKVYRFLLKPVSPGRARLAVEASVKHHIEAPDSAFATVGDDQSSAPEELHTAETPDTSDAKPTTEPAAKPDFSEPAHSATPENAAEPAGDVTPAEVGVLTETGSYRLSDMVDVAAATAGERSGTARLLGSGTARLLGIGAAIAIVAIGVLLWLGRSSDEELSVAAPPDATPTQTETDADIATPVIDEAVEQALQLAESALLESRLQVAGEALRQVADADPDNARLPFLNAQLAQAQLRLNLADARTAIREGRFEDAADMLSAALALDVADTSEIDAIAAELESARSNQQTDDVLALANARLESGDLLTPANSNARYYYELVLANDPENTAARQGLDIIANRLVLQARSEIDSGNFDTAQELLYDARAIDSSHEEMIATAGALQVAREAAAEKAASEKAAAEQAAAKKAASEKAAAKQAAAKKAAAEKAAAEKVAAEEAAAEKATAEQVAAERDPGNDEAAAIATESTAAESESAQSAATTAPAENVDTPKAAAVDSAAVQAPADKPTSISSLERTRYVAPKYPRSAVRRNLSGWVDLTFTVSTDGTVKDIGVRGSKPGDVFVAAATRAVEQWEFEPVLENGVAVEKRAAVRMMFSLD